MRFRLRALALHAAASALLLALTFGTLYLGWYRWPGWYLAKAPYVVAVVALVDLALGPLLTLVVANPAKPRRELVRDIAVIVALQLAALAYGADTLWRGRPLYYAFSVDRLQLVQAAQLSASESARARRENPGLAPHWYERPRWVWAPLPEDPRAADAIMRAAIFGGPDVVEMPRYFRPWDAGLPALRARLGRLSDLRSLGEDERRGLAARMARLGLSGEERNALLMWGDLRRVLVIFEPRTLAIRAILAP